MDAKNIANFVNSVGGAPTVTCTSCGRKNPSQNRFCVSCGSRLTAEQPEPTPQPVSEQPASETAFKPVSEQSESETAFKPVSEQPASETAFKPVSEQPASETAFKPVSEQPASETAFQSISEPEQKQEPKPEPKKHARYVERESALASGLPEWDVVPPHMLVRRHR